MGRSAILSALIATAMAGCATVEPPPVPHNLERIVYQQQSGPFCGRCQLHTVTLAADGRAWIETGHWADRETWAIDNLRMERVGPETYTQLYAVLAPYHPGANQTAYSSEADCADEIEDLSSAAITWIDETGSAQRHVSFGCRDGQALATALIGIRRSLPLPW